jgi:hypothetical protein
MDRTEIPVLRALQALTEPQALRELLVSQLPVKMGWMAIWGHPALLEPLERQGLPALPVLVLPARRVKMAWMERWGRWGLKASKGQQVAVEEALLPLQLQSLMRYSAPH